VEVEDGRDRLADVLASRGLQVRSDGRAVLIALQDDGPYDLVRDAVVELGLPLVRMEQRRASLEDLFRGPAGAAGPIQAQAVATTQVRSHRAEATGVGPG
jgi:ABC-2 type transport system ATP-binding protein